MGEACPRQDVAAGVWGEGSPQRWGFGGERSPPSERVQGGELASLLAGVPGCLQGGRFGRAKHSIVAAGVPGL